MAIYERSRRFLPCVRACPRIQAPMKNLVPTTGKFSKLSRRGSTTAIDTHLTMFPMQIHRRLIMHREYREALCTDFGTFARKVVLTVTGKKLGRQRYLDAMFYEVDQFATGSTSHLLINAPPRHAKSLIASVCGALWILAHKPSARILLLTNADRLSTPLSRQIRRVLR